MPKISPRNLVERYAAAVAYVLTQDSKGNESMGPAFHVGEGVFLTARHVVENRAVLEVATTVGRNVPDPNGNTTIHGQSGRFRRVLPATGQLEGEPLLHPDPKVDVAAIRVAGLDLPDIPLGGHYDDWIDDPAFLLNEVVVMGYPPVPLSKQPVLVTSRGEVNAVVDKYVGPHPHFVISAMARGGFSGGPCISTWNFALGMVTESLLNNNQPSELGCMAVVSIEPLRVCLEHHGLMPESQNLE